MSVPASSARAGAELPPGLLPPLVRVLAPQAPELLSAAAGPAFLAQLEACAGVRSAAWLPTGPGTSLAGRLRPREVDWGLVRSLAPGEVCPVDGRLRRRSARLASAPLAEAYVSAPAGAPTGALWLRGTLPSDWDAATLRELAATVATLHGATSGGVRERVRRELALGRRAATLTHDLRNQLTLALLLLERLRAEPMPGGPGAPAALGEGAPLDRIDELEEVLCAARSLCAAGPGDGAERPAPRPLLLRSLLVQAARAAGGFSRAARRVRVRVRCATALRVHGELHTLERLVGNLLSNAVEASFDGGEVRAEARELGDGRVEVSVDDRGCGMGRDALAALLAPGASGGAERGGTGYGTASLFEALERLGGEAVFESAPGAGTRVRVSLAGVPPDGTPAVLVVDRDRRRRRARTRELRALGLGTWEAEDARAALGVLRGAEVARVVLARGTFGAGLEELAAHCRRQGIPIRTPSVTRGTGGRIAPPDRRISARSAGSLAGTPG